MQHLFACTTNSAGICERLQHSGAFEHTEKTSDYRTQNASLRKGDVVVVPAGSNNREALAECVPRPLDILLIEKRSACFVTNAPFAVPTIHFWFDFRYPILIPPEVPDGRLAQHIRQSA